MNSKNGLSFKNPYYIEPCGSFGWIFRKEGSDNIIKRAKYKTLLIVYAADFIRTAGGEILICDENGMLVEIKKFQPV